VTAYQTVTFFRSSVQRYADGGGFDMRWLALLAGLVVLGCGESARAGSSGVKIARDGCIDLSTAALGLAGTYVGRAEERLVNPVDAGVWNADAPAQIEVVYSGCDYLWVAANFGAACGQFGALHFTTAIQSNTTFVLAELAPLVCRRHAKACDGLAQFFIAYGSVTGEQLTLQVSGGVYSDPGGVAGCGPHDAWPYSYVFTGTRSGP
jgi:hypothetical protein